MNRWEEFVSERPQMAEAGRALLYQFRVGLGYLATVRKDGGPRVHPVCPVIANGGLYLFIGNHSPKLHDLLRDGRFALHSFPNPEVDDEFYVTVLRISGSSTRPTPQQVRSRVTIRCSSCFSSVRCTRNTGRVRVGRRSIRSGLPQDDA